MSLPAIRNCIRRLRVERKVHTMVLISLFPDKVLLINHHGVKLAEYPASQVCFGHHLNVIMYVFLSQSRVSVRKWVFCRHMFKVCFRFF